MSKQSKRRQKVAISNFETDDRASVIFDDRPPKLLNSTTVEVDKMTSGAEASEV